MKFAALLAVGLLVAAAIAWFAGEQHYDNCIREAELSHRVRDKPASYEDEAREFLGEERSDERRLREAVDDCSRLPF